jgi:hypothetical protein
VCERWPVPACPHCDRVHELEGEVQQLRTALSATPGAAAVPIATSASSASAGTEPRSGSFSVELSPQVGGCVCGGGGGGGWWRMGRGRRARCAVLAVGGMPSSVARSAFTLVRVRARARVRVVCVCDVGLAFCAAGAHSPQVGAGCAIDERGGRRILPSCLRSGRGADAFLDLRVLACVAAPVFL